MAGRGSSCIAWLALGSDRSSSSHLQLLLLLELLGAAAAWRLAARRPAGLTCSCTERPVPDLVLVVYGRPISTYVLHHVHVCWLLRWLLRGGRSAVTVLLVS
jgi:hypothetical protein